jgi:hypothetical protein
MDKQNAAYPCSGVLFSCENETDTGYNIDEP